MKPSTSCFIAILIALALVLNKVEPRLGWRLFLMLFLAAMIGLYGYACHMEGPVAVPKGLKERASSHELRA